MVSLYQGPVDVTIQASITRRSRILHAGRKGHWEAQTSQHYLVSSSSTYEAEITPPPEPCIEAMV